MRFTVPTFVILDSTTPVVVNVNNEFTTNRPYESFTDLTAFTTRLDELGITYAAADFVVPSVDPDWKGFLTPFYSPAFVDTTSFHIIETAVQSAWLQAATDTEKRDAMSLRTFWNNCMMGLNNPTVRSREWLVRNWNYLLSLLTQNGVALTEEQRRGIEDLMRSYNLLE